MTSRAARETTPGSTPAPAGQILEHGNIYFFYRPRVDHRTVESLEDVQRLYMILSPRGGPYRLVVIPRKRLPSVDRDGGRTAWAFVESVAARAEDVEDALDPETYRTQTRGERQRPAARPAGEGVYAIVRHGDHTHLAYALELPPKPGPVQRALNILEEASYIVSVKNPDAPSGPGTGLDEAHRATFPERLRERFQGRRFASADPPGFLDHEGAEIILIGAAPDVSSELGIDLDPERETVATAEIFGDLKLEKSLHPVTPLLRGRWV
jgi:hypothetical protein